MERNLIVSSPLPQSITIMYMPDGRVCDLAVFIGDIPNYLRMSDICKIATANGFANIADYWTYIKEQDYTGNWLFETKWEGGYKWRVFKGKLVNLCVLGE